MKLLGSILTSAFIVLLVWGLALFQMELVETNAETPVKSTQVKTIQPPIRDFIDIAGISRRINLDQMNSLWQAFESASNIQDGLIKAPSKLYVYYRNFSSDSQVADISIGYPAHLIKDKANLISVPEVADETLLDEAFYTNEQLSEAWQKIDYGRELEAVLEIHQLNLEGSIRSSKVLVNYQ